MNKALRGKRTLIFLAISGLLVTENVSAQPADPSPAGPRWEVWGALTSWPGLGDLQPAAGGSFNSIGYGLGASVHWPVTQLGNGELLLGVEGAFMATDSDIPVNFDDLIARDAYAAFSAKWMLGQARNLSVDAGVAFHLFDIAQIESDYYGYAEFQSWEESATGGFVGATWDVGAGQPGNDGGLSLGFKVHFVDFGIVRDEEIFVTPILGMNAGDVDGPLYVFKVGYRWR